jgi:hypothetical protein
MELIPQVIEKQELNITQALEQAERLFSVMDISANTKEDYLRRLPVFLEFIKSNGLNINTYIEFKKYLGTLPYYSISTKK